MSGAELLVNVTPSETRVALVENGILKELHIEARFIKDESPVYYQGCNRLLWILV